MPIPFYSDTDLLSENELNKIKNKVNMKMKELYSILEPSNVPITSTPQYSNNISKTDALVDIVIDLLVKNGTMLVNASSYIITKDALTKNDIKKIKDTIKKIEDDWKNWIKNRPDAALLSKLLDINNALKSLDLLEESKVQLESNRLLENDIYTQYTDLDTKNTTLINDNNVEISNIKKDIGTPATSKITTTQEDDIKKQFLESDSEMITKVKQLDDDKKKYYFAKQEIDKLNPQIDKINDIIKDLKLLNDVTQELIKIDTELLSDPTNNDLQTKKKDLELEINTIESRLKSAKGYGKNDFEKNVLNKQSELYNEKLKYFNEFNPVNIYDFQSKSILDFEKYFIDTDPIITTKLKEIKDLENEIQTKSDDYLKQYIIENNLQPLDDAGRNKLIIKLQEENKNLQNEIDDKKAEYDSKKLANDSLENDLKIKSTSTLSNINTTFGTNDYKTLQEEALKIENITGMTYNSEYQKYKNDLDIESAKLNIDTSVFNAVKVKIDSDSLIDFDKIINQIIINFKTINDEFKTIINTASYISNLKFNKLIKTYEKFKLECLIIKKKIKELPGNKLSLSGVQGVTKIQFSDIEDNVKTLYELLNNFDIQINELKQVYNPPTENLQAVKTLGGSLYKYKYY